MKKILASLVSLVSLLGCVPPTETTPNQTPDTQMSKPAYSTCHAGNQATFYHMGDISEPSSSDKALVSLIYHKGEKEWKDGNAAVEWFLKMSKSPGMAFYYSSVNRNSMKNTSAALRWIDFAICHAPFAKTLWLEKLDLETQVLKNRGSEISSTGNMTIMFLQASKGLKEKYKKLLVTDNAKLDFLISKFRNDYEILSKLRDFVVFTGNRYRFGQINRLMDKIKIPDNNEKLSRAVFLYKKNSNDEALKLVNEVLASDPMYASAYDLLSDNTADKKLSEEYKKLFQFYRMMPQNWKTKWSQEKWNIWADLGEIKKTDDALVKLKKLPLKDQVSLLSSSVRFCHACQYNTPKADACFKLIRELFNLGPAVHGVFEDMILSGIHCHGTRKAVSQAMLARPYTVRNKNLIPLLIKYEYEEMNMEKLAIQETLVYYGYTMHMNSMIKNAMGKNVVFTTQTMETIRALSAYFGEDAVSVLKYIKKEKKDDKALQIHLDLCLWGVTENKDYLISVEKNLIGLSKTDLSVSHMCQVNTEHADFKAMVENIRKEKKEELNKFLEFYLKLPEILKSINLIPIPMIKKQGIAEDKLKACTGGDKNSCENLQQAWKILLFGLDFDNTHPAGMKYVKLVEFMCDKKMSDACIDAGVLYGTGRFVKKDSAKSLSFYRRACSFGNSLGCSNYSWMFLNGEGTEQDYKTGVKLSEKACKMGCPMGCTYIARKWGDYNPGKVQAGIYLKRACDLGLGKACMGYAVSVDENPDISDDQKKQRIGEAIADGCWKGHNESCSALYQFIKLPPKPVGKQ